MIIIHSQVSVCSAHDDETWQAKQPLITKSTGTVTVDLELLEVEEL